MADAELAGAARAEVAYREKKFPLLVANSGLTAEAATVDYQAWTIIAGWLAGGHFVSLDSGGAGGTTRVGWPECDEAAARAANTLLRSALDAEAQGTDQGTEKAARLWKRQLAVAKIARKVSLRRQSIDDLNAHFQRQRGEQAKAA